MRASYVYIMANRTRTLYIGVTNDIAKRVNEHKSKLNPGFTARYNIMKLVYMESFSDIRDAIAREKQLKGWRRNKKMSLIESVNPGWRDLAGSE
jgi:putative endonuclease